MSELLRRIRFLFRRAQYERELAEEMRHHLAMLEEDGRPGAQARRQFGNVTLLQEESRSMWTFAFFDQFAQDLRYAARAMAANPLFTATAVMQFEPEVTLPVAVGTLDSTERRLTPVPWKLSETVAVPAVGVSPLFVAVTV